jgi:hypothetical protein
MTLNGVPASGGLHDNKDGADIDYATATNHASGPIFDAFFDDDPDELLWIPAPYNPNYTFNTYNVGANANLPILRAFDDEKFPCAIQEPQITKCCEIVITPKPNATICSGIIPTIDDLIISVNVNGTDITSPFGTINFNYFEDSAGNLLSGLSTFDFKVGPNTIYIKVSNGDCESDIVPISITVKESPAIPKLKNLGVNEITICDGEDIMVNDILSLIEDEGLTYTVYTDANACIVPYTDGDITADAATGTYTFYVVATGANDCSSACKGLEITVNAKACVKLDLKVFLEGVVQQPLAGKMMDGEPLIGNWMTAHIQDPTYSSGFFPDFNLPVENCYHDEIGVTGEYHQINDPLGPAGEVVDWILVEIWGNVDEGTLEYDLVESQVLLLKPNGSIRDTLNQIPSFNTYSGSDVQIVVRHRDHVPVMSKDLINLNPVYSTTIPYDFTDINHVYDFYSPAPVGVRHGVVCLWAGDINMDGIVETNDMTIFNVEIASYDSMGKYLRSDVTMDGFVESADATFVKVNLGNGMRYSPYLFFNLRTP